MTARQTNFDRLYQRLVGKKPDPLNHPLNRNSFRDWLASQPAESLGGEASACNSPLARYISSVLGVRKACVCMDDNVGWVYSGLLENMEPHAFKCPIWAGALHLWLREQSLPVYTIAQVREGLAEISS